MQGEKSRRLGAKAVAGSIAAIVLLSLVASTPESPFHPLLPEGEGAAAPLRWLAEAVGLDRLPRGGLAAVAVVALLFGAVTFLYALRCAWRGEISLRVVVGLGVAFSLLMLALPLLFSRDVYNYSMYGRIAGVYHANPYVAVPADFPSDPLFPLTGIKWHTTPSVYGPAFTLASSGIARAVDDIGGLVFWFKAIAVAASIGTLLLIARVAGRVKPDRAAFAVLLFAWNPVVLFNSVASGHNDMLVALSVAAAVALLFARRELAATAVLTLGALVKAPAAVPLLLLVVYVVSHRPKGERARAAAAHLGVVVALVAVFAAPFMQTSDPSLGLIEASSHEGGFAVSRFLSHLVPALGTPVRYLFLAGFLVVFVLIAREVARGPALPASVAAAWGWALLFITLTGPVLLPWYIVWTLPLAWLLPRVPLMSVIALSVTMSVFQMAAEPLLYERLYDTSVLIRDWVIVPLVCGGILAWLAVDARRRLRLPEGDPFGGLLPAKERQQVAGHSDGS
ncbi:MAG: hypothetical protein WD757_01555 [Actinomycetota bacterium]